MPLSSSVAYMCTSSSQGSASKDQLQNLRRGHVSLKLGTEQPDDKGADEKIAQLEQELENSKAEIAYLEKINRITEASYVESSAIKEERWRSEAGDLRRIIHELQGSNTGRSKVAPEQARVSRPSTPGKNAVGAAKQDLDLGLGLNLDFGIHSGGKVMSWPTYRSQWLTVDPAPPSALGSEGSQYKNVAQLQLEDCPHPDTRFTAAEKGKQREYDPLGTPELPAAA